MYQYLGIVVGCVVVSWLAVGLVRRLALRYGWVAAPRKDRWHEKPTALHGGVGILAAFLVGTAALFWSLLANPGLSESLGLAVPLPPAEMMVIIASAALFMAVTGWVDDCVNLKPGVKLLLELIAVTVVIVWIGPFPLTPLPWVNVLVSYFWFVGIVNAVNLLDNMDGVSSGVVIIGLCGLALTGWYGSSEGVPVGALWALVVAACAFGFWLHNRPPARIFMGDSGSLFLGFTFAALIIPSQLNGFYGLDEQDGSSVLLRFLIAVALAAIPILDTSLVTVTRLMRGQSPSVGGKDHTTHRLAFSGLTHWQTLGVLYGVSAFCVGVACMMAMFPDTGLVVFLFAFVALAMVAVYIASVRIQVSPIRREGWQQLVTSFIYRVPLIKMLVDVLLVSVSLYAAYLIRFDFVLTDAFRDAVIRSLPVVIVSCVGVSLILRIYEFSWRLASSRDVLNYAMAAALGVVISMASLTMLDRFGLGYSRGAFVIFGGVYFLALTASRFSFRFLDDLLVRFRMGQAPSGKIPLLVYGTGREARWLLDEIQHDIERWGKYCVVGLVHDDRVETPPSRIAGIPVHTPEQWMEVSFESRPEVIVADDKIENADVLKFARSMHQETRVRRYARRITEVMS